MCLQLCYAMLMAVQHGLCACSAACYDLAPLVAVCLLESYGQSCATGSCGQSCVENVCFVELLWPDSYI